MTLLAYHALCLLAPLPPHQSLYYVYCLLLFHKQKGLA